MSGYQIERYTPAHKAQWDNFIKTAKNSSFLHNRDFIGYHKNRFEDFSLLISKDEKILAVIPANKENKTLYSHKGLTYGGLILGKDIGFKKVKFIFEAFLAFLEEHNFENLIIKCIPELYTKLPSREVEHLMLTKGAKVISSELNYGVDYALPNTTSPKKARYFRKNENRDFTIKEGDFEGFWGDILEPRLSSRFNAKPVHSLSEIKSLHKLFPDQIKQFNLYQDEKLLAGITVFINDKIAKAQYAATSPEGEKLRAMDQLFIFLIKKYRELNFEYFDLGTVKGGKEPYNFGLIKQKEELGGVAFLQQTIKLKL